MTRQPLARPTPGTSPLSPPRWHRAALRLAALALVTAAMPGTADAQLGRLKKLKNAVRPDSAARAEAKTKDSLAAAVKDSLAAAGVVVPAESAKGGGSRLLRAASAVKKGADKFEAATGISAKDAALAATGLGMSGIVAKKLGVDPSAIAGKAISSVTQGRAAAAQAKAGAVPGMPNMPAGIAGMLDMAKMQSALGGAKGKPGAPPVPARAGDAALGVITPADAQAMVAFQQEMMQVATAASGGDAAAQARLEAWQAIVLKYEPALEKLTVAASAGDLSTMQKVQQLQLDMMRDWSRTGAAKTVTRPAGAKVVKP